VAVVEALLGDGFAEVDAADGADTPTTVKAGDAGPPTDCWPIGPSCRNSRTSNWSMTTTGGLSVRRAVEDAAATRDLQGAKVGAAHDLLAAGE
jgi:hypothetical protein